MTTPALIRANEVRLAEAHRPVQMEFDFPGHGDNRRHYPWAQEGECSSESTGHSVLGTSIPPVEYAPTEHEPEALPAGLKPGSWVWNSTWTQKA